MSRRTLQLLAFTLLPFVLSPVDEPSGEAIHDQMVEGLLHWSLPARRP